MPLCMPLGPLWQSWHAWITYRSICRVVIATTDHITHGTISHVKPGLTENVPKTLSKTPCLVAKRMSLTLHLLLFEQSM